MANSMLNRNNNSMLSNFLQFAKELKSSGKNPEAILNNMINSGAVNKEQLDNAVNMAKQYESLLRFIK